VFQRLVQHDEELRADLHERLAEWLERVASDPWRAGEMLAYYLGAHGALSAAAAP